MVYLEFEHCPKCGAKALSIDITSPFYKCTCCARTFKIYEFMKDKKLIEKLNKKAAMERHTQDCSKE